MTFIWRHSYNFRNVQIHIRNVLPYVMIVLRLKGIAMTPLHWRHNGRNSVPNHQPHDCFFNRLFRQRSKETSKLHVTGLCVGNSRGPVNSPHKWPVTRKMFPFDDVIMSWGSYWRQIRVGLSNGSLPGQITRSIVNPYLWHHMSSLDVNLLKHLSLTFILSAIWAWTYMTTLLGIRHMFRDTRFAKTATDLSCTNMP